MDPSPPATKRPDWLPKDQQRFAILLGAVAILLVGVVLSRGSPAVAIDKPLERLEGRIRARHRNVALHQVESVCRRTDCDCLVQAAAAGLDADAGKEVLALLDQGKACTRSVVDGLRAEALVRAGQGVEGTKLAMTMRGKGQQDPHSVTAIALATYAQGDNDQARTLALQAVQVGGGDGAKLLLGLAQFKLGDLDGARSSFADVQKSEPEDTDAVYNLATVAQAQNRYGEARKLFLAVLRVLPKHKESRYNLGVLAHSIGAENEARHHLEKLKAIAPGDPLVAQLEATLATPLAHPPSHVLKLGSDAPPKAAAP